jgi:hypothetical protein
LTSGPTWGTGVCGSDVVFTAASSQYISVASPPVVGDSTAFTVCLWEKTSARRRTRFTARATAAPNEPVFYISVNENAAGDVEFGMRDNSGLGGAFPTKTGLSLNDGNWHHICGVQNTKSERAIFTDGVWRVSDTTTIGTLTLNTANVGKFQRTTSSNFMDGSLDQVRVYSVALTTAQIQNIYNNNQ